MFQRIMLPWDGSHVALGAFDVAIDLARRYEGELIAVSVANSPARAETPADRRESEAAAHDYLQASFHEVEDRAHRAGIEAEHRIVEGEDPARALLSYAHEHGVDLIVCGHHRRRRAGRLLLHDIAEDLFRESQAPVLVVGERTR
jgi:nucleotide-binding universal stress UspA family protein